MIFFASLMEIRLTSGDRPTASRWSEATRAAYHWRAVDVKLSWPTYRLSVRGCKAPGAAYPLAKIHLLNMKLIGRLYYFTRLSTWETNVKIKFQKIRKNSKNFANFLFATLMETSGWEAIRAAYHWRPVDVKLSGPTNRLPVRWYKAPGAAYPLMSK